tara:strand:+ start:1792 stop:2802 length:1011 start_codon:yes stop_codon:yes gene_type:complete
MVINDLVYFYSYNHSPLLSFLEFPNQTHNLHTCKTVVISPYSLNLDTQRSILNGFISDGYRIIVDASTEILGKETVKLIMEIEDPSNVIVYTNTYEPHFESDVESIRMNGGSITVIPFFIKDIDQYKPKYTNNTIKHKDFLLLSGKSKPTRTSMVGLLSYYNLIEKGHVSFFGNGLSDNKSNFFYDQISDYFDKTDVPQDQQEKVREGLSKLPQKMTLDVNNLTHAISHTRTYNGDYYNSVDFVVVVESDVREEIIFITEKTMKCIQQNKKFILFSTSGSLSFIKDQVKLHLNKDISHLTDWCDTSYDNITDTWERLNKVVSIIKDNTRKDYEYSL